MPPCQTRPGRSTHRFPVSCFLPLLPVRTGRSFLAAGLLRALMCLVAFCVVAQATALSAQRTLGRAHHHVGIERGIDGRVGHGNGHGHGHGHGHDHDHGHAASVAADHDHPPADSTVVYVEQADGRAALSQGPATARFVLDLDGLMPDPARAPRRGALGHWPNAEPAAVGSHVTRPLERPPRG